MEIEEDTKIPNAATIKVVKQDHTLANLLRSYVIQPHLCVSFDEFSVFRQLLSMSTVLFAGYKVPHPLQPYFLLKIQTDGSCTPAAALETAANALIAQLSQIQDKFKREFNFREIEPGEGGENNLNAPFGAPMTSYNQDNWAARDYLDL